MFVIIFFQILVIDFNLYSASETSSPTKSSYLDTSDQSTIFEFEEIPSREKKDVLETLQVIGKIY